MSERVNVKKKSPAPDADKVSAAKADAALPALGPKEMLRFAWTQLTSMRTALFLLLLLAVAAVPGSLFPQRPANPSVVTQYIKDHPDYGKLLDSLQLYDVYSSVWFSAIYLLLFVSLIGCVVPRAIAHYKAMRSQPPRTPKRLSRLPEYGTLVIPADAGIPASDAIHGAAGLLRKRGYRVEVRDDDGARPSLGAERGLSKEVGNLVFHTSLIGVLVSVAIGGLFGYSGQRILVEGDTFVNTLVGYDQFTPGTNFQSSQLQPYSVQLDKFDITFDRESQGKFGQPIDFSAAVTTKENPDAPAKKETLKVNDPITLGGTSIYLTGNGYAPVVTIRDGDGNVAMQGPVVAKLQGDNYYSSVVIKVPDAKPEQLGFQGFFLPTAFVTEQGVSFSGDPDLFNPQLSLNSYYGDLGLDTGSPQNVFEIDVKDLTPLNARNLDAGGITLSPGSTYTLPDGKGSISFDGVKRYVGVDIHHNPGQLYALIFALLAVAGLILSLYVNRRRAWVRTGTHDDGRTMVEYGLLARGEDHRLAGEAAAIRTLLTQEWGLAADPQQDSQRPEDSTQSQQTPSSLGDNGAGTPTPASPAGPEKDQ
ncbi:ResB family protein [Pseudarthrobacter chlorophenolicus A6]|uniref:ResB family protein n=1 Tax=Pseudarthrobacter chlorophenolicus (strain ATCC 700700 / DSM 12829 / CIP 107037 / JCM 12360 / KCTC 9906 / NCIMB 13794 / A6) TaxID=452863 RepID=B8HF82_PSECP|nr:cytochrome c biogenesis protein ResB [Pseudarthrobacter chlorophenolicus]ACL41050.1 ResB family protein [Pseudarthrobacter chlorophenolicus A6]SDQ70707.1 cytochrome c biogenesis protein [Pseudarthrobacter chlorophenolicus]